MGPTDIRHIALYGSLRRGQPAYANLGLERLLRYRGPCALTGLLYDLGDYPALLPGTGEVHGEVHEIAARHALAFLDAFEACNPRDPQAGLYRREAMTLNSPRLRAWTYVYNRPVGDAALVEGGDWVAWRERRPQG